MLVTLPFAVLATGGSPTQVGLVVAAQTVPFLLFGLLAGVVADRYERKRVLIFSDAVRLVAQLVGGLLLVTGQAEWWHLALTAFVYGSGDAFFSPAFIGLLPLTVAEPHQLQPANALRAMSFHIGSVAGPAVAALLLAVAGPGEAMLVDAATFVVAIAALLPLRPRTAEAAPEPSTGWLGDLRGGWREVRSRDWVQAFLGAMVVYHVVVLPSVFVLGPVLAEEELGGATAWAAITIAYGVGSIIGDGALLRFRPRRALRASSIALVFASCQAVIFGSGLPLAVICALELVAAIGVAAFFTLWEVSLQEHIPSHALSRVASYDYMANVGLMPIGVALAGPFAAWVGIHTALAIMSAVGVATALVLLSIASVRTLPRADVPGAA